MQVIDRDADGAGDRQAQRNCWFDTSSGLFTLADKAMRVVDMKSHKAAMSLVDAAPFCSWYEDPSFVRQPWEEQSGTVQPCGSDEELQWEPQEEKWLQRRLYMYKDLIAVVPDPGEVTAMRAVRYHGSDEDSSEESSSDESSSDESDSSSGSSDGNARRRTRATKDVKNRKRNEKKRTSGHNDINEFDEQEEGKEEEEEDEDEDEEDDVEDDDEEDE